MNPSRVSTFHEPAEASTFLENWNKEVEYLNGFQYKRITVQTSFGHTRVWACNTHLPTSKTIVIFPGARTCGLFWDMDNALRPFRHNYRIYITDVNGQPSLSHGHNPAIKTTDYGRWATDVLDGLNIEKTIIAGASLGGLICMKLCLQSPERVEKAILMNPAGIRPFSFSIRNLYYNLLPIVLPTKSNLARFLNNAIFCPPTHDIPPAYKNLISDYLLYALMQHKFRGDYPEPLRKEELEQLTTDIFLIVGAKDLLFPPDGTIRIARQYIQSLRGISVLPATAHGIETSKEAINLMYDLLENASIPQPA
jgi:pimeloyl-ACP methyl ester carboxylesterase